MEEATAEGEAEGQKQWERGHRGTFGALQGLDRKERWEGTQGSWKWARGLEKGLSLSRETQVHSLPGTGRAGVQLAPQREMDKGLVSMLGRC